MQYYFDYGFANKQHQWLDGQHKREKYEDGKQAFARYIQIQRNGKNAERDLKAKNMLPEDNAFECTIDIFHNGEYCLEASLAFFYDAFQVLNAEQPIKEEEFKENILKKYYQESYRYESTK